MSQFAPGCHAYNSTDTIVGRREVVHVESRGGGEAIEGKRYIVRENEFIN